MHIECVVARSNTRPTDVDQRRSTDDCAESIDERCQQSGLKGCHLNPGGAVIHGAGSIEGGRVGRQLIHSRFEPAHPCIQVRCRDREPHPVLQDVGASRRIDQRVDQQQSGMAPLRELGAVQFVARPENLGNIHTSTVGLEGFAGVSGRLQPDADLW